MHWKTATRLHLPLISIVLLLAAVATPAQEQPLSPPESGYVQYREIELVGHDPIHQRLELDKSGRVRSIWISPDLDDLRRMWPPFDIDFAGGTVAEFLEHLNRQWNRAHSRLPEKLVLPGVQPRLDIIPRFDGAPPALPPMRAYAVSSFEDLGRMLEPLDIRIAASVQGSRGSGQNPHYVTGRLLVRQVWQVYSLSEVLGMHALEDIVSLLETAWAMLGHGSTAQVKYHESTRTLFISGSPIELSTASKVFAELQ